MKIGFIISRTIYYKYYSPIIDEALKRNIFVFCFHNYGHTKTGVKGYNFPEINKVPSFLYGKPRFQKFQNANELIDLFTDYMLDAIISLDTPNKIFSNAKPNSLPLWILVQHHADFFTKSIQDLNSADMIFALTKIWHSYALDYAKINNTSQLDKETLKQLQSKIYYVGYPQLISKKIIDVSEIRSKYGIPTNKKVVLLLHHGLWQYPNFWGKRLFNNGRLMQIFYIILFRQFKYLNHIIKNMNFKRLVKVIRFIADNNDAVIIVKYRKKTPLPYHLKKNSLNCIVDEEEYPPTISELMEIADLCISTYRSMAVLEAAHFHTPFLSIEPLSDDKSGYSKDIIIKEDIFYNTDKFSLFNYSGVSYITSIPYLFNNYKKIILSDYHLDPDSRNKYVNKYIRKSDLLKSPSQLIIDTISEKVNIA